MVKSLAIATVRELQEAGLCEKVTTEVMEAARSLVSPFFMRADEMHKMYQNVLRLTTGSEKLDEPLGSGLESQAIGEFYGEYSAGKSQMAHQPCVNVQLPVEKGGSNGGRCSSSGRRHIWRGLGED